MASNTCKSCMRAFRRQACSIGNSPQISRQLKSIRPFRTSSPNCVVLPESTATPATSIPPVSPSRAPINSRSPAVETPLRSTPKIPRWKEYNSYGWTEFLYKECSKQANYNILSAKQDDVETPKTASGEDLGTKVGDSWWLDPQGAALQPTFSTWSQVTMLHMWLFTARFRAITPGSANTKLAKSVASDHSQQLLDHFFYDAEDKMMENHNMSAKGTRQKYLQDLHIQWRGCLAAYDEALIGGDAVLAAAVWRNIFKASEDVDVKKLAMIVGYVRRTLEGLGGLSDERMMESIVGFGDLAAEESVVAIRSRLMNAPIRDEKVQKKDVKAGP